MSNGKPELMFGVRVQIIPDFVAVPRSWRERLASWPWQPWRAVKLVPNRMIPDGMALAINDPLRPYDPIFLVRQCDFARFRQKLEHHTRY